MEKIIVQIERELNDFCQIIDYKLIRSCNGARICQHEAASSNP